MSFNIKYIKTSHIGVSKSVIVPETTTAAVFIRRTAPFYSVVVYEQADIDWYRINDDYIEVGYVLYDTMKRKIVDIGRR